MSHASKSLILYLNLYVLLRVAGQEALPRCAGATVGLVSGNTEVSAHWIAIAAAWSWFPLLVAGMIRLLRAPVSFGSIVLFSLSAGLMYCEPCATSNSIGVLLRNLFHCRCMLAVAKGTALLRLAVF